MNFEHISPSESQRRAADSNLRRWRLGRALAAFYRNRDRREMPGRGRAHRTCRRIRRCGRRRGRSGPHMRLDAFNSQAWGRIRGSGQSLRRCSFSTLARSWPGRAVPMISNWLPISRSSISARTFGSDLVVVDQTFIEPRDSCLRSGSWRPGQDNRRRRSRRAGCSRPCRCGLAGRGPARCRGGCRSSWRPRLPACRSAGRRGCRRSTFSTFSLAVLKSISPASTSTALEGP